MTRVLIIEDDADGRTLLLNILLRAQMQPEGAHSAEEAIRLLDKYRYDAVIIDLMLPGISGLELLKNIRRNRHTARLCCAAVTAFHSDAIRKQALEMGFNAYFTKPLDIHTFGTELQATIDQARA